MSELPTPISDQDKLLSNIAIGTPDIEDLIPNSRQEVYLKYIALNGIQELPVSISQGGTGATTEADARLNLGIGNLNSLNTSTKTSVVDAMNEINRTILSDHSLYFNADGSNGTITLSDNAVNYDYFDIYFKNPYDPIFDCSRIYNPNGKTVVLTMNRITENKMWWYTAQVVINGKTITWQNYGLYQTGFDQNFNPLAIGKIVGYK